MKICILSNLYPPFVRGGAEIVAAMQAEALKASWQHVFVVSSRPKYIRLPQSNVPQIDFFSVTEDVVNDVSVFRFRPVNLYYYPDDYKFPGFIRLFWHLWDTFNIFSYFTVKKILLEEKPDVVVSHNLMGLGFLLPKLIKKLKIKHVHVVHDLQLITPSGLIIKNHEQALTHRFFRWIGYVWVMKKLFASPNVVISPSKFLLDAYNQRGFFPGSRKMVLPNPINSLQDIKKVPGDDFELLYLGQVNKAKGVIKLVKYFREISKKHIKLNIVGMGQDLDEAKKLAKGDKRIIFHGWLESQTLRPLLARMDILLVPSLCYENSPTVIYEALSIGLPVITADIGGAAELIRESYNGWVVPAGDFQALNTKILSLYEQREQLSAMADNCRASVADFQIDNYISNLLKILNHEFEPDHQT